MSKSALSTCQELLRELQNLQQRFGLLAAKKLHEGVEISLEESQQLCVDAQALKEEFVPPEVQQLLENLEKQYDAAKEMALEFSPEVEIPSKELVMEKIWAVGVKKLREIVKFGKPTLLMTPPTSMLEKQKVLNEKKRYPEQTDSYFKENAQDKFWNPKPETLTVSIVDGLPTLPQLSHDILKDENGELTRWDVRYKKMYEQFKARNIRMITAHEYAILMQLSLKNYEKLKEDLPHENSEKEIVDFCATDWLFTAFYQSENVLTNSRKMPYGCFVDGNRRMVFAWNDLVREDKCLRFRGAVKVFSL